MANMRVQMVRTCSEFPAGDFQPGEPLLSIFTWVEKHLAEPMPFVLASPALSTKDRKLPQDGTIQSAKLLPAFVLNFSWVDRSSLNWRLCLSEAALSLIQTDEQGLA